MKSFFPKIVFSSIAFLLIPLFSFSQCAMCRAALMTGDEQNTAEGINHGITYLMVIPYILAAITAFAIYQVIKKELKADQ